MRRHTGTRDGRGARGLRLVVPARGLLADMRRVRTYVGKHRKTTIKRGLLGVGLLGVGLVVLSIMLEMPHSTALLAFMFIAMAAPGVAMW